MGLWLLRLAILGYRRFLSGRGPMRRVSCTFAGCESCSAYGLRIAQTAKSLPIAVSKIRARLRRCAEACVLRIEDPGKEGQPHLYWGACYDRPQALAQELHEADELLQTRVAVLTMAVQIARHRGQWAVVEAVEASIPTPLAEAGSGVQLAVRRSRGPLRIYARLLGGRLAAVGLAVGLSAVAAGIWGLAIGGVIGGGLAAAWARRYLRQRARLRYFASLSAFSTAR